MAKRIPSMTYILSDTFYDTIDPRRRQEVKDSRMIREDHKAMANLSPRFIHREFNEDLFRFDSMSSGLPWGDDEIHED